MTTQHPTIAKTPVASLLDGWVEVFKAGPQTDSERKRHVFSVSDLDEMAANHVLGAAPAVLGHPKHDDPAYAWVAGYQRKDDCLYAKFEDVNPAFAKGVADKSYFNRSLSIFKDPVHGWRVRHVGWLGAVPPAIDGLSTKPVAFAADDAQCLEFSAPGYSLAWGLESVAALLRKLRDNMIAKDGLEAADAALPAYQIDSAMEAAQQARQAFAAEQAEDAAAAPAAFPRFSLQPEEDLMTITQAQLDAANQAAVDARAEADKVKADFAALNADVLTMRATAQKERIGAQIDKWMAEGKLYAHEGAGLAEYMASLEAVSSGAFTFSQAGGDVQQTPAQFHAAAIEARKPLIALGVRSSDVPEGDAVDTGDSAAIGAKARDFMASEVAAGRVMNIASAVDHVMKKMAAA